MWVLARGVGGFASTYARCPHTGPRCLSPWRQRAAYCWMIVSCWVKVGRGHSRATQGTGPLESSMENPPPRPPVSKSVLSTLSVRG